MKITNSSQPIRPGSAQGAKGPARATGGAGSPAAPATGKVQISPLSAELNQLEAQFSQSDFDTAKVSAVSSAISQGSYRVDAGVIADKLLANAADVAGRKA